MASDQLNFLKEQIDYWIVKFNSSRLHYRKVAFWTHLSITILAALSTIILGLNIKTLNEAPRIVALIITGFITVISAFNTFFDNKSMWIAYNNARNEMMTLKFDIAYLEKKNNPIDNNSVEEFKERYQRIIDNLNRVWTEARSK